MSSPLVRLSRFLLRAAPAALLAVAAVRVRPAARGLPYALGAGDRTLRRVARSSPHAPSGRFTNTEPAFATSRRAIVRALRTKDDRGRPAGAVPLVSAPLPLQAGELAATWFGHSSVLLEIDGHRVLTDPVWGERVSPSPTIGPRRLHPVPVPLSGLPPLDVVLISHDHYDHLELPAVQALTRTSDALFVVPLGIGAHLRHWGVPARRIVELDWGAQYQVGALQLSCTPARHFSGRTLIRNTTQWASWVIHGPRHRVFFGGDTGYTTAFREIGDALGPFDLTLLPIGAYADLWPDVHMTPEEAVRAHQDVNCGDGRRGMLLPVHWATFDLGFHGWAEPVHRLNSAAAGAGVRVAVPRPGERIDGTATPLPADWWSRLDRPSDPQ